MTFTASIAKHTYDSRYNRLPDTIETISGDSMNDVLATFFRDYDNRYKYCNSISHSFTDKAVQDLYRDWISDVKNYADNGGDMW